MRAIFLVCCCFLFTCSYSQNKIFEYQNKIEQFKKNGDTLSLNYTILFLGNSTLVLDSLRKNFLRKEFLFFFFFFF